MCGVYAAVSEVSGASLPKYPLYTKKDMVYLIQEGDDLATM